MGRIRRISVTCPKGCRFQMPTAMPKRHRRCPKHGLPLQGPRVASAYLDHLDHDRGRGA